MKHFSSFSSVVTQAVFAMVHSLGLLETGNEMVVSLSVFHDLDLENVRAMNEFKATNMRKLQVRILFKLKIKVPSRGRHLTWLQARPTEPGKYSTSSWEKLEGLISPDEKQKLCLITPGETGHVWSVFKAAEKHYRSSVCHRLQNRVLSFCFR